MWRMAWSPYQTALRNALASLFPDREDTRDLLDEAGIPVAQVALGHRPASNWHAAIREAANQGKLEALVAKSDSEPVAWARVFAQRVFFFSFRSELGS